MSVAIAFLLLLFCGLIQANDTPKTPAESVRYMKYSQNAEIGQFLSYLDHHSRELRVRIVGQTLGTEEYGSKDIFLCVLTEEGVENPQELNRKKPTLYIVASKHGNEQSAKEAALWFMRDVVLGELRPLLKKLNILILPQANPYGNWFDKRRNEQNLDLNRDHVKIEAPETEVINRVFREWFPEVTLDVHEKGDSFHKVEIGCVSNANIHPDLQRFSRNMLIAEVDQSFKKAGVSFHEYLITQKMGIDSSAGVTYRTEDLESGDTMKRYSTSDLNDGRNSPGIYETLSFIQEGASRHDISTLKERTRHQYLGIKSLAESTTRHSEEILSLVSRLRKELLMKSQIYDEGDLVHLRMKYAKDEKESTLTLSKYEKAATPIWGILKVNKKAGDPLSPSDIEPYPHPSDRTVVETVVTNWFPQVEPIVSVTRPLGYIIPSSRQDIAETLLRHGLKLEAFTRDASVEVELYRIQDVTPAEYDYLPPQTIDVNKETRELIVKRGDFYIGCSQEGGNLIPCLLEPQSQYGLIRYWKYKLVPELGDVYPLLRQVKESSLPLIPYKRWNR